VAWKSIQPLPTGLKLPTAEKSQYEQVGDIIVSAALHSADPDIPVNDYLANLPPLSGQNTGKNFVRFSSRCGPMFAFRDSVILLLSWDKPIDTLTAMIVYCFVCKVSW
jgi:hypothetical protein